MKQNILSVLVHNRFGTLTRVAILFGRRGCNIDTMTADEAEDPRFTRITVTANGEEEKMRQVYSQLRKVEDVAQVELLSDGAYLERSFVLVRLRPGWDEGQLTDVPDGVYTKKNALPGGGVILEVLGETAAVKRLIHGLDAAYVDKLAGSGCTALGLEMKA